MTVELDDSYESLLDRAVECIFLDDLPGASELAWRVIRRLRRLSPETLARRPEHLTILLTAHTIWAELERWQGRHEQAIAVSEQLLAEHPELDEINMWIGRLRVEQGQVEEGMTILRNAAERMNTSYGWNILGTQLADLGQADQAERCYRNALACAKDDEDAATVYRNLFEFYKTQHQVADAIDAWNAMLVLTPDMADQSPAFYGWLIDQGEIKQAQLLVQRERNPLIQKFYNGLIAWRTGQPERARRLWQDVFQAEDAPIVEWMEAGLRLGHWAEVIEEFVRTDEKDYISVLTLVGLAYALGGNVEMMHDVLQKAVYILEKHWPARSKISERWSLVTDLITDPQLLTALSKYFEQNG